LQPKNSSNEFVVANFVVVLSAFVSFSKVTAFILKKKEEKFKMENRLLIQMLLYSYCIGAMNAASLEAM
jgi:hypothetical protein